MSATARAPLVRAGPGVSAWTALPERDRALLFWLIQGDVVTAELAACQGTAGRPPGRTAGLHLRGHVISTPTDS